MVSLRHHPLKFVHFIMPNDHESPTWASPQEEADLARLIKERLAQGTEKRAVLASEVAKAESDVASAFKALPSNMRGSKAEYDGIDDKV